MIAFDYHRLTCANRFIYEHQQDRFDDSLSMNKTIGNCHLCILLCTDELSLVERTASACGFTIEYKTLALTSS